MEVLANLVNLKYTGGRSLTKNYWNRKAYVFKKENDWTLSVPQAMANFLLPIGEYTVAPIVVEKKSDILLYACDICGFSTVSKTNLKVHQNTHKGEKGEKDVKNAK